VDRYGRVHVKGRAQQRSTPPRSVGTLGREASGPEATAPQDRVDSLIAEIDQQLEQMSDHQAWCRFLDAQARFHNYSWGNVLLILKQRPDAQVVAGFKKWQEMGRHVKRGEKALWILAPCTRKFVERDETGEEKERVVVTGFRGVPVFDASQTEGEPLPEPPYIEVTDDLDTPVPEEMTDKITAWIEAQGFRLIESDDLPEGVRGMTRFEDKTIRLRKGLPPGRLGRTLAHEAAHIACGHGDQIEDYHCGQGGQRNRMEIEADSVAYVLGRHFGLAPSTAHLSYIDGWATGNRELVRSTTETVASATRRLLDAMG